MFESIFTHEMAILALAVTSVMIIVGRVKLGGDKARDRLNRTWWWQRFGTLFALALGVGLALLFRGFDTEAKPLGESVLFGIIAAAFATVGRNALKDNLFKVLEDKK